MCHFLSVNSCWENITSFASPAASASRSSPCSPPSPFSLSSLVRVTMLTDSANTFTASAAATASPREEIVTVSTRERFTLYWTTCGPDNSAVQIHGVSNGPYSTLADKTAVYAIPVNSPSKAGSRLHELIHMPRAFGMQNSSLVCWEGPRRSDRLVVFRSKHRPATLHHLSQQRRNHDNTQNHAHLMITIHESQVAIGQSHKARTIENVASTAPAVDNFALDAPRC